MRDPIEHSPARRQPGARSRFIPSLPTLDPRLLLPSLEPTRSPLFPIGGFLGKSPTKSHTTQLFYLARAGVHHAVNHFLDGSGVVLMPAYHHGVEVEAVRQTGATVQFYRVDEHMRADLDDLSRKLRGEAVKVAYLTHFVGFAQPIRELACLCRALGVKLVEDCALALLSRDPEGHSLGAGADAAFFCLYKTLPVPHGGLLVARDVPPRRVKRAPLTSTLHHLAGLSLADLELRGGDLGRQARALARWMARSTVDTVVENVQTGTMHLDPRDLELGGSPLVARLVGRIDLEMVLVRRRRNFRRLAEALDGLLPILGHPLPLGACPLFVPVRVPDKRRVLDALHARGIDAVDFWGTGDPQAGEAEFPEVATLRREVVELPCHQSLDDDDIDFVAQAVKEVVRHA